MWIFYYDASSGVVDVTDSNSAIVGAGCILAASVFWFLFTRWASRKTN